MSAKGRGRHEGGDVDFYPTPPWCVHRLLDAEPSLLDVNDALEPTCGNGAVVEACVAWAGSRLAATNWTGVELRRNAVREPTVFTHLYEGADFRTWVPPRRYGLAIGNPPFALAEPIVRKCLDHAAVVAMLLRVGFLGSDERVDFFRSVGAKPALRILPDRPSFDGIGTDASTYAWFVWGSAAISGVDMLGSTPLAVRKSQTPQGLSFESRQASLLLETGT